MSIVIPMKSPAVSKQRLATVLSSARRQALSLWMLEHVIRAALPLGSVTVIGGDARVAGRALALGARWEPDPWGELNQVLQAALAVRPEGMLFLAGDLPTVATPDLRAVQEVGGVGVARGRRGGTNAVYVPAGATFAFSMGEGSFQRHLAQPGVSPVVSPPIEADVDLPEDLAELERQQPRLWHLVEEGPVDLVPVATGPQDAPGSRPGAEPCSS